METKTTGTESPDDANQLEKPAESAPEGSDDRNAESDGEDKDWKALAISLQEKAKRVNDLEARLKDLEGDSPQPPVAESPEVQHRTEQIEDLQAKVEEFRRLKDPVAAMLLEERAARLTLERDLILTRQLDRVPQPEQDDVLKHFNKNRHRLGDINAARSEIREKRLEIELEETKKRLELLERPPDPDVMKAPPTHGREISARQTTKKLTEAAFDATAQSIRASKGELAYLKYMKENAGNVQ